MFFQKAARAATPPQQVKREAAERGIQAEQICASASPGFASAAEEAYTVITARHGVDGVRRAFSVCQYRREFSCASRHNTAKEAQAHECHAITQ